MTSLYFAPLEKRFQSYFLDSKYEQSNINRDYELNQFNIAELNAQQNLYNEFQKSKMVLNKLEEEQKKETGTKQAVNQLKKEGRYAEALALEGAKPYPQLPYDPAVERARQMVLRTSQPESLKTPESTTTSRNGKSLSSVKSESSKSSAQSLASQVAEIAKIDKTTDIYKKWKEVEKAKRGENANKLRTKDAMIKFAEDNSLAYIPKTSDTLDEVRTSILSQLPKKMEAEGLFKRNKNKKMNNIVFYVHSKNGKNTRKK